MHVQYTLTICQCHFETKTESAQSREELLLSYVLKIDAKSINRHFNAKELTLKWCKGGHILRYKSLHVNTGFRLHMVINKSKLNWKPTVY